MHLPPGEPIVKLLGCIVSLGVPCDASCCSFVGRTPLTALLVSASDSLASSPRPPLDPEVCWSSDLQLSKLQVSDLSPHRSASFHSTILVCGLVGTLHVPRGELPPRLVQFPTPRTRNTNKMSFWGSKPAAPPPPPHPAPPLPRSSPQIDATTVISLLGVLALLGGAYGASIKVLPSTTTLKTRILFIWHLFDALIHFVFEGSFLYNCFFVTYALPTTFSAASRHHPSITLFTPPDVYWLGREDKLYGANYGTGPFSRLWQEYAKADKRWGGTDLTVVSLELLTVFVAGPLACWICWLLAKDERKGVLKKWFWMVILATGEIYGGESLLQYTTLMDRYFVSESPWTRPLRRHNHHPSFSSQPVQ